MRSLGCVLSKGITVYSNCIIPLTLALSIGAGFQNSAPAGQKDRPLFTVEPGRLPTIEEALQKHRVQLTAPVLVQALKSTEPEVRWLSAAKLAQDNVSEAVPAIRDALRSEQIPVTRVNLASSLARLGEAEGFDSLIDVCLNPDMPPYLKTLSARYMFDLNREDKTCRDALVEALQSGESGSDFLTEAVSLLLRFHDLPPGQSQEIFQSVVRALSRPEPRMRLAASRAIVKIGESSAIPYLQSAINREKDSNIRSVMQEELSRLQREEKR
jgi:HEAT repeat protein